MTAAYTTSAEPHPLLSVRNLRKYFPVRSDRVMGPRLLVQAVDDVSFTINAGETLGIVGESGCGKSTTARLLMHLIAPDAGEVWLAGRRLGDPGGFTLRELRRNMQMVFQDSYASLNPRLSVQDSIAFGPRSHGVPKQKTIDKARELLALVGLDPNQFGRRYPHELSGGQRQRVNIARALALDPILVILDEAVSALDKSIEAQVLNLLMDLKHDLGLTYLFISHDLNVVQYVSDYVLVMYLGKVAEVADRQALYEAPVHPYTRALLSAVPIPDPKLEATRERTVLRGEIPSALTPPGGCVFHPRCPIAQARCSAEIPRLREIHPGHWGACHLA